MCKSVEERGVDSAIPGTTPSGFQRALIISCACARESRRFYEISISAGQAARCRWWLYYFITGFTVKTSGAMPMRGEPLYPVQRRAAVGCVRESQALGRSLHYASLPCH
eukprot:scaffold87394_cov48-Phaeocystis_antarctica.AAC.1